MKPLLLALALIGSSAAAAIADDEFEIRPGTKVTFATAAEGAKLLAAKDTFVGAMSPFDRAARLKTDRDVTEEQYLTFAAKQARDWSAEEKAKLQTILAAVRTKTAQFDLRFPPSISLLKTTGLEEGNAAYCRENAIVLPQKHVDGDKARLEHTIAHELFHIYRRHYADNRKELYKIIGFGVCSPIALPEEMTSRKITNPDAPLIDSIIRIRIDGKQVPVTPVLFSETPHYDTKAGGEFFRSLVFKLMVLDEVGEKFKPSLLPSGEPHLVDVSDTPDYLDQVGRNTQYVIHPEEILAENFVLMIENDASVASPEIVTQLRTLLTK
jgi:hypothetical protein